MNMYYHFKVVPDFQQNGDGIACTTCGDIMSAYPGDCSPIMESAGCGGQCDGGCGHGCWILGCDSLCVRPARNACDENCQTGCHTSSCRGFCTGTCNEAVVNI